VHLFCPSLGFLVEAEPRLKTGEDKRHFLAEEQKTSLKKLQIHYSNYNGARGRK
jgi:hypothetical protein